LIPRVEQLYDLRDGFIIGFEEPLYKDMAREDISRVDILAMILTKIAASSIKNMDVAVKKGLLEDKSAVLVTAMLNKMDEFLTDEVKVTVLEKPSEEELVASVIKESTASIMVEVAHSKRLVKFQISLPRLKDLVNVKNATEELAAVITKINDKKKEDYSWAEWVEIVGNIPYLIARDLPAKYREFSEEADRLFSDAKKLERKIENLSKTPSGGQN